MGRLFLRLDGPDYKDVLECGFAHRYTMDRLVRQKDSEDGSATGGAVLDDGSTGLWVAPGTQWLMCYPEPLASTWYKNPDFHLYNLRKSLWTFATAVSANVREWEFRRSPGESYNDFWMDFGAIPASLGTQPISVDFTALGTALGETLPSGVGVLAALGSTNGGVTPYIQFCPDPEPAELFIFGWGDMCLVFQKGRWTLLRTPNNDHQTWDKLSDSADHVPGVSRNRFGAAPLTAASVATIYHSLTVIPVGWNQLCMMRAADAEPWYVTTRDEPTWDQKQHGEPAQVKAGPWWIAGYSGGHVRCQIGQVAYRVGHHAPIVDEDSGQIEPEQEFFNLGHEYAPTATPEIFADAILHGATGWVSFSSITSGVQAIGVGGSLQVTLQDESGITWSSDGTHFRGAFDIQLTPSVTLLNARLSPQIREIQLRFPPVLDDGPNTNVVLDDTEFKATWTAEASLEDYEGKELRFPLTKAGADAVRAAGLDTRHAFPIHLEEDTDADNLPDTVRVRGWCHEPSDTEEIRFIGDDVTMPQDLMTLIGKGLMVRGEEPWVYRPELANPANEGKLAHTDAVKEAFLQTGFDVTDSSVIVISTDTAEDLDPILPGCPPEQSGNAGMMVASPYAPSWDETKVRYAVRIAEEWTTWLLYEEVGGRVLYTPNPAETILDGGADPSVAATFYRTRAAAVSAGKSPRQIYHAHAQRVISPILGNRIKTIPCDTHEVQVIVSDTASHDDPTNENYIGRWLTKMRNPRMAVNKRATTKLCIAALRRFRRKKVGRTWTCHLAPWEVDAPIDVGSWVILDGLGTYQIVHLEVSQAGPSLFKSRITGIKKPTAPVLEG